MGLCITSSQIPRGNLKKLGGGKATCLCIKNRRKLEDLKMVGSVPLYSLGQNSRSVKYMQTSSIIVSFKLIHLVSFAS